MDWIFELVNYDPNPKPYPHSTYILFPYQTGDSRNCHFRKRIAQRPYVRIKANIEFLRKLINLPDQHPPKPRNISNQIQINVDPLAQYGQLQ
jgi:hypothetical protein